MYMWKGPLCCMSNYDRLCSSIKPCILRQIGLISLDQDQTLQNGASDQGLHSLPFIQQFLDTTAGGKMEF